jgi:hypothetical protein
MTRTGMIPVTVVLRTLCRKRLIKVEENIPTLNIVLVTLSAIGI